MNDLRSYYLDYINKYGYIPPSTLMSFDSSTDARYQDLSIIEYLNAIYSSGYVPEYFLNTEGHYGKNISDFGSINVQRSLDNLDKSYFMDIYSIMKYSEYYTVVVLHDIEKADKIFKKKIFEYLQYPNPNIVLILTTNSIGNVSEDMVQLTHVF